MAVYDSYPAWVVRNFGAENPAITDKEMDPDRDGLTNLFEFALLMDPNASDAGNLPAPVFDPGDDALTLTYSKNFVDPTRLAVLPEVSTDLLTWHADPSAVTRQVLADTFGLQIIRAVDTTTASAERTHFMRLRVVCPDGTNGPADLKILRITGAPSLPSITFTSEFGQSYQLESTMDPTVGWTSIGSAVTALSTSTTLSDTTGPIGPFRFYRVRRLP